MAAAPGYRFIGVESDVIDLITSQLERFQADWKRMVSKSAVWCHCEFHTGRRPTLLDENRSVAGPKRRRPLSSRVSTGRRPTSLDETHGILLFSRIPHAYFLVRSVSDQTIP
jgi:hypothetical protein